MIKITKKLLHIINRFPNPLATIYFNFYYFPFDLAVKLPVFVGWGVKLKSMGSKNSVIIKNSLKRGSVTLGSGVGSYNLGRGKKSYWQIDQGATVLFKGECRFSNGFIIHVRKNAILEIGDRFTSNAECMIACDKKIVFGNDCMCGWSVSVMDTDLHRLYDKDGNYYNFPSEVIIGNHVWVASNASILKKTNIGDNCVVAKSSVITNAEVEDNCIVAGNPAKVVKGSINWSRDLCIE